MKKETVRDLLKKLEPWQPSERYGSRLVLKRLREINGDEKISSHGTIRQWVEIVEAIEKAQAEVDEDDLDGEKPSPISSHDLAELVSGESTMNIPQVAVSESSIKGWDEFEQWALRHDAAFSRTYQIGQMHNLDQEEKLKLLCAYLTHENSRLFERLIDAEMRRPIIINT